MSQVTVLALVLMMAQPIMVVGVFAVILSAVLANRMAKRIVRPLNSIDLDHPLDNDSYEELTPLLRRIHQQREQISEQVRSLQKKTDEFEQVTSHMKEGLVLLVRGLPVALELLRASKAPKPVPKQAQTSNEKGESL